MARFKVTQTIYKDVIVEADTEDDAVVKACTECLFDDAKCVISDIYDVDEVNDEDIE